MNGNLFARLADGFPADRRAPFLETAEGAAWSLAALLELTGRLATLLKAAGVEPGDRVAALVEKSPEAVCLYLACLQAGAVHVPLDAGLAPDAAGDVIRDAAPRLAVCDPGAEAALAPVAAAAGAVLYTLGTGGEGRLLAEAAGLPSERSVARRAGADLAAILYAPAGRPRGAMLSHDNLWSNVATLHWLWGFRPGDVMIHALPLWSADGLFVALNLMLMNGGRALLLRRFDAEQVVGAMGRATVLIAAPGQYERLLASPRLTRAATAGMRLFVSGAGALPAAAQAAFEVRTGARVLEGHGMAETGMLASNLLDGERRAGSVGLALPGVALRVADRAGRPPQPGEAGGLEAGGLEVRGPGVFGGYWRRPEQTAEAFRPDGWFITGETATIAADGYVTIAGREADGVVSGSGEGEVRSGAGVAAGVEAGVEAVPGVAARAARPGGLA